MSETLPLHEFIFELGDAIASLGYTLANHADTRGTCREASKVGDNTADGGKG